MDIVVEEEDSALIESMSHNGTSIDFSKVKKSNENSAFSNMSLA